MEQVKRCSRCILSSSFPRIQFDEEGVCNFCREELLMTSSEKHIHDAQKQIDDLIAANKEKGAYDAVVCYSGGKDSTYTLMLAVQKYGLNVLAFTYDNGFLSPYALKNIKQVVEFLGIDHIMVKPSFSFMKALFKSVTCNPVYNPRSFSRISANCNACISLVNMTALRIALEKDIPLIFAGFTLGQIPVNSIIYKNNYEFLKESREPVLKKLRDLVGEEVDRYFCLDDSVLSRVKEYPDNVNILCVEDISEEDIIKKVKTIGWEEPVDVDGCSSNCLLNTFNNYVHTKIWGYNPYELELSHLIKKDQLSRTQALEKIANQPANLIGPIMERLEITDEMLESIASYYSSRKKK